MVPSLETITTNIIAVALSGRDLGWIQIIIVPPTHIEMHLVKRNANFESRRKYNQNLLIPEKDVIHSGLNISS